MMKCVEEGHEIVALANLYPVAAEELDSYMYQSVGHDAIEAVAKCLGLPLFRRPICGTPKNMDYDYVPTQADEVEDLYELLKEVQESIPDVKGVSSGAIHSNYQKNRVEDICKRLDLASLAYLWGREQVALLDEMIENAMNAVLIKTAVIGLGREDLGRSILEMREKLFALKEKFQINVCGEGGEFESLTLDCPLYKHHRMEIEEAEVVTHREHDLSPVVYLKIRKIRLIPKPVSV
jgi:diphthine-ammonia ligase